VGHPDRSACFEVDSQLDPLVVSGDGADRAAGAVAHVVLGVAGGVEAVGGGTTDHLVTDGEPLTGDDHVVAAQRPVGAQHDPGPVVEGAPFDVVLGHHR
jgi:hypothetical protein